jgi:hypothetical protein
MELNMSERYFVTACPASALMGPKRLNCERRISGSS